MRSNTNNKSITVFLQYYLPHVSGLTNMAAELAEYAAAHGYKVKVHCVGKRNAIESINGVQVHRHKKNFSVGRGIFSFQYLSAIWNCRKEQFGIAHVHMPLPESFIISMLLPKRWKIVCTYHCDAPKTNLSEKFIANLLDWSHKKIFKRADAICFSSKDYADHSRLQPALRSSNCFFIPATSVDRQNGKPIYKVPGKKLVGFIGRPTAEKGINVLLEAMLLLPKNVELLFAGPSTGLSEKSAVDQNLIIKLRQQNRFHGVGFLEEQNIADFYSSIDVFAFPSTNSFEAFGIVQVEAISAGAPVVASALPGVRTIVGATKFGEIVPIGDAENLAIGISKALETEYDSNFARKALSERYLAPSPHEQYLEIYNSL